MTVATGPGRRRGEIVVLGGYGAVGRAAAARLHRWFPGRVVIAGRDGRRAAAAAREIADTVRAREVDVGDEPAVARAIDGAGVAVVCVEHANVTVARACLERGVNVLDVTATADLVTGIERLHGVAVGCGATGLVSVGLAPGVSNLLARACLRLQPTSSRVDLTFWTGIGGDHGAGSRAWILRNLAPRRTGRPATVDLPGVGRRRVHTFPFSDQASLSELLAIPVTTRLGFDPAPISATVFALRDLRLFAALDRLGVSGAVDRLLAGMHLGHDRFVVHASATDPTGATVAAWATGRAEARASGIVAAHAARLLVDGNAPVGVLHLDELVEPASFLHPLAADGITTRGTTGDRRRRRSPVSGPTRSPGRTWRVPAGGPPAGTAS